MSTAEEDSNGYSYESTSTAIRPRYDPSTTDLMTVYRRGGLLLAVIFYF